MLGPSIGFFAALIGSGIARLIKPTMWWMFGLVAEPLGVMAAGLLAKGRWKEMQIDLRRNARSHFLHPYGRMLPLGTVLDLLLAFIMICPTSKVGGWIWKEQARKFTVALLWIAFVSTVADSMTRVFILVPWRYYEVLGLSYAVLAY